MSGFMNDVRYAIRQVAKNPGFAAVAVATLAVGVAANTVIFTVTDATILKKLPFPGAPCGEGRTHGRAPLPMRNIL